MKLKLLEPHQGLKAGAEWNCPWAAVGQGLIAAGKALAIEECDQHLNPTTAAPGSAPAVKPVKVAKPVPKKPKG